MSETAINWLLSAMIGFAIFFIVGSGVSMYLYRRFGYPPKPRFLKGIRLRDDIETINKKIEPALQEGFRVKERHEELLVLEKSYDEPPCVMTVEFHRPFGWCPWSSTFVNLKCIKHPWLSWKASSSSNAFRRKKPSER